MDSPVGKSRNTSSAKAASDGHDAVVVHGFWYRDLREWWNFGGVDLPCTLLNLGGGVNPWGPEAWGNQ